jgi:hypothetical protein
MGDGDISQREYEELLRRHAVGETADFDDDTLLKVIGAELHNPPSRITARPDDPTVPYDIQLEIRAEDGRHVVEQLVLTRRRPKDEPAGPPITSTGLARVRVAALTREAVAKWTLVWDIATSEGQPPPFFSRPQKRRGPTRRISDSELVDVARLYREGKADHRGIEAVSEAFGVSRSTAHRAIRRAAEKQLLAADEIGSGGRSV